MTTTIKATHTPGPWKAAEAGVLAENLTSYGNWYVCSIIDPDNEEHKANMRLIAATPDLLAVCVDWLADIDAITAETPKHEVRPAVRLMAERAREVIARATS